MFFFVCNCRNMSGFINTKLNFSEANSTFGEDEGNSSSRLHQFSSSFGRATFNSTLDIERRVTMLNFSIFLGIVIEFVGGGGMFVN